jgi:hypothetical protein
MPYNTISLTAEATRMTDFEYALLELEKNESMFVYLWSKELHNYVAIDRGFFNAAISTGTYNFDKMPVEILYSAVWFGRP